MPLKKFIPYWYDNENTKEDEPILASNEAEARGHIKDMAVLLRTRCYF